MMMKAGLTYSDWRLMAHFQRRDWLARATIEGHKMKQELEKADGIGSVLSIVVQKLLGIR